MRNQTVENGVMLQYFEWYMPADATLWNKLKDKARGLSLRGVTSVWMPPAYKGQAGINDVGYGVYDLYDLGEFDQKGTIPTKYGTKDEYLACIKELQANNVDVYADIVLNHKMGADETEEVNAVQNFQGDRLQEITPVQSIEAWTRFTFPGRSGKYSDFIWDSHCFSGVDWDQRFEKGGIYQFEGETWNPGVDRENENFDYLMGANINHDNPRVREHLKDWGRWYLETTGVDGFRLDAVKHIANDFYSDWLGTLREESGKELFAVGEYWHADINVLEQYLDACGRCMSLFDVPLHYNFFAASHSNGHFDMRGLLNGTLVQQDPEKAVTFVNNHDTQRGQALESAVLEWFVPHAYAVILLRPQGYPCMFYGDYYGVDMRRLSGSTEGGETADPNVSIVPDNAEEMDDGFGFTGELDVMTWLRRTRLFGQQHDYFDHEDIIGWTLAGDEIHPDSGLAVVMTNRLGGEKTMYVGTQHAGEIWADALGLQEHTVTINEDGTGVFSCGDGSVSIWIHIGAVSERPAVERFDESAAPHAVRRFRRNLAAAGLDHTPELS